MGPTGETVRDNNRENRALIVFGCRGANAYFMITLLRKSPEQDPRS